MTGWVNAGKGVALLPLGLCRVTGESMRPTLAPGDLLLVRYQARVRPGRLVTATFADGTLAVKRAVEPRPTRTGAPGWWLLSDAPEHGVDSRHRGPVPQDRINGVVIARVWPGPRRL